MSFRGAVEAGGEPFAGAYRVGKSALRAAHSAAVVCADTRRFVGSVDLDETLRDHRDHARAPRWDYALGVRIGDTERALWIEVHPANAAEVGAMIAKLSWLKALLRDSLVALGEITPSEFDGAAPFVWLASGRVTISPNSPAGRRLRTSGLRGPVRLLRIP